MKIKFNLLVVAEVLIAISLTQISCSSSQRSAVPCPDFSHSRNMKSRHAQLKNTYRDRQPEYRSNSAWAHPAWFKNSSKVSEGRNLAATSTNSERFLVTYIQPVSAELASMLVPAVRKNTRQPSSASDMPAYTKRMKTSLQGCDTIVLRNGDIMQARVVEIGQREIRYSKCEDNEGPVFVVNITDVFMIKYPNGTRDYFTSEKSPAPSMGGTAPVKTDGMAVTGFIGSLVGLFILGIPLGIMAFVFGTISLGKIQRHPERYKGKGFAIASIIIGAIDVIGMLIVIAAMS